MANNKWNRPDAPPPPLFTGQKERDLVKQVNDELIERVIGQSVIYYPISMEHTNYHPLYGEAIKKTWLPPIRIYALVEHGGIETTAQSTFGLDVLASITVHFHDRRLTEDQNLYVREGDFLLYGDSYYEILSLSQPREIFGRTEHKIETSAQCYRAREGLFDGE
tara:strand:+ start:637 stop:1128 length:492 start_codon:yes stop_codon:yes gene_type:complete